MKLLVILLMSFSTNLFASEAKCDLPQGVFTDVEMVLNQFVLGKGSPNWGDWCYDSGYSQQSANACNQELDAWDEWLKCSGLN